MPLQKRPLPEPDIARALFPAQYPYPHFQDAARVPFDVEGSSFSRANAWWLAEASLLSYWDVDAIKAVVAGIQSEATVHALTEGDSEGFVASFATFAIVAFRGTESTSLNDLFTDVRALRRPWRHGGRVHDGFLAAFDDVWPMVLGHIPKDRPTWFTGHSLGGALATLAADRFVNDRGTNGYGGVYTFGSPMVGDRDFVDGFNRRHGAKSFRVVNDQDGVPTLPPAIWGFRHVNEEHYVGDDDPISALVEKIVDHTPSRYAVLAWNKLVGEPGET
jgi:surfactin synthase thioesterase subunit